MGEIIKQINSYEKEFDFGLTEENPLFDDSCESSDGGVDNANASPNDDVENISLEEFFSKVLQKTHDAVHSENDKSFGNLVHQLSR